MLNQIIFTNALRLQIKFELKTIYKKSKLIVLKLYEIMYLLVLLNITSLEKKPSPRKYSFKLNKYLFITNFSLFRNVSYFYTNKSLII